VPLRQGETLCGYRFPATDYDFIGARDATIGDYQMCSLISPPDFADHESARLVAQLAREALFDPANAEVPGRRTASKPLRQRIEAPMSKPISAGRFLRAEASANDSGCRADGAAALHELARRGRHRRILAARAAAKPCVTVRGEVAQLVPQLFSICSGHSARRRRGCARGCAGA
jgi:hypothetical protein